MGRTVQETERVVAGARQSRFLVCSSSNAKPHRVAVFPSWQHRSKFSPLTIAENELHPNDGQTGATTKGANATNEPFWRANPNPWTLQQEIVSSV